MDIPTPTVLFLNLLTVPITITILASLLFLTTFLAIYPFYVYATLVLTSDPVGWEEIIAAEVLALAGVLLILPLTLRVLGLTWMEVWGYILSILYWVGGWTIRVLCWMSAKVFIYILCPVVSVVERMVEKKEGELRRGVRGRLIEALRTEKEISNTRTQIEIIDRYIAAIERMDDRDGDYRPTDRGN